MAQVKFYKGLSTLYETKWKAENHSGLMGAIWFTTDTNEIILNGTHYGITPTDKTKLEKSFSDISLADDNKTITLACNDGQTTDTIILAVASTTKDGLMSKEDKATLDTLNKDENTTGSVRNLIKDAKDELKGTDGDEATAETIAGAKKHADVLDAAMDARVDVLEAAIKEGGSVSTQITNAINKLDKADTAVDGQYVSAVSEADGIITVTRADLPSLTEVGGTGKVITTVSQTKGALAATAIDLNATNVTATASNGDDAHVAVEGATVAAQIESLAKSIKTTASAAKSYNIAAISGEELAALGTNVKEAYKLVDGSGAQVGAAIKIYKDSSLKEVALNDQTLNFTYILDNGTESTVGVDVSNFLAESEFENGLQVVNHKVSVKKDDASESFLTVGADGIKLSGVQTAIDTATNKAATEVVEDAAGHVTVTKSAGANGQAIYTIGENDIASDTALTAEVTRAKKVEDAIEAGVGLSENGGYVTPDGNHYLSGATNVMEAIVKLDTQAHTEATNLASEAAARKAVTGVNADSYSADSTTNYLKAATNLMDADKKLDAQIKANADAISSLQTATDVVKTLTVNKVNATVSNNHATVTIGGANIELTGYAAPSGGAIVSTNTVNQAIYALEDQLIWHEEA